MAVDVTIRPRLDTSVLQESLRAVGKALADCADTLAAIAADAENNTTEEN